MCDAVLHFNGGERHNQSWPHFTLNHNTHGSLLLGQWGIAVLVSFFALWSLHTLSLVITLFSASPVNTCFFYFLHPPLSLSSSSVCPVRRWKQVYTRQMKINNSEIDCTVVLILINRMLIYEWIDSGTCPILRLFRMTWVEVTDLLTRSMESMCWSQSNTLTQHIETLQPNKLHMVGVG